MGKSGVIAIVAECVVAAVSWYALKDSAIFVLFIETVSPLTVRAFCHRLIALAQKLGWLLQRSISLSVLLHINNIRALT